MANIGFYKVLNTLPVQIEKDSFYLVSDSDRFDLYVTSNGVTPTAFRLANVKHMQLETMPNPEDFYEGDKWLDPESLISYTLYNDGTKKVWVELGVVPVLEPDYLDSEYVTIDTPQHITGEKVFDANILMGETESEYAVDLESLELMGAETPSIHIGLAGSGMLNGIGEAKKLENASILEYFQSVLDYVETADLPYYTALKIPDIGYKIYMDNASPEPPEYTLEAFLNVLGNVPTTEITLNGAAYLLFPAVLVLAKDADMGDGSLFSYWVLAGYLFDLDGNAPFLLEPVDTEILVNSASLSVSSNSTIKNLGFPVENKDAANKEYVDTTTVNLVDSQSIKGVKHFEDGIEVLNSSKRHLSINDYVINSTLTSNDHYYYVSFSSPESSDIDGNSNLSLGIYLTTCNIGSNRNANIDTWYSLEDRLKNIINTARKFPDKWHMMEDEYRYYISFTGGKDPSTFNARADAFNISLAEQPELRLEELILNYPEGIYFYNLVVRYLDQVEQVPKFSNKAGALLSAVIPKSTHEEYELELDFLMFNSENIPDRDSLDFTAEELTSAKYKLQVLTEQDHDEDPINWANGICFQVIDNANIDIPIYPGNYYNPVSKLYTDISINKITTKLESGGAYTFKNQDGISVPARNTIIAGAGIEFEDDAVGEMTVVRVDEGLTDHIDGADEVKHTFNQIAISENKVLLGGEAGQGTEGDTVDVYAISAAHKAFLETENNWIVSGEPVANINAGFGLQGNRYSTVNWSYECYADGFWLRTPTGVAYLDVYSAVTAEAILLIENTANWTSKVYTGPAITGVKKGARHYDDDYFFEFVDDNLPIRVSRV